MKPSCSVSCSYGGTFVSCGNADKVVRVRKVVEQPELAQASAHFEAEMESADVANFCLKQACTAKTQQEHQTWGFMKVIFASSARQELASHLGLDSETITKAANEFTEAAANGGQPALPSREKTAGMTEAAEETVKKALLVGNFEAAVECCFRTGNMADALMLASCGGAELWSMTQQRYFESEAPKRPYLAIVSAVICNQLVDLVASSDASKWQETLALLSTYGQPDAFPSLCIALGDSLASAGKNHEANLCYMCSLSLEHSVKHWLSLLYAANKVCEFVGELLCIKMAPRIMVLTKSADCCRWFSEKARWIFWHYTTLS